MPTEEQHFCIYELWELYVHLQAWGLPEYGRLDTESRAVFGELVRRGELFAHVEGAKRALVRSGYDVPLPWLRPICAATVGRGETLAAHERDALGVVVADMYAHLVRTDPDAQPDGADVVAAGDVHARPARRRGARRKYDARGDARIWQAWQTGGYSSHAELAVALGEPVDAVKKACDRERKRRNKP